MKKQTLFSIPSLIGTLLMNGCASYYVPNSHNVPLLREKNDARLSLTGGKSGFEFQGSYAVTDKIGVMVNTLKGESESPPPHPPYHRAHTPY